MPLTQLGILFLIAGIGIAYFTDYIWYSFVPVALGAILVGGINRLKKLPKHLEIPITWILVSIFIGVVYYKAYGIDAFGKHALGWAMGVTMFGTLLIGVFRAVLGDK